MLRALISFCTLATLMSGAFSTSLEASGIAPTAQLKLVPTQDFPLSALQGASTESQNWLNVVDAGRYGESWDKLSALSKFTVSKEDWIKIMEKTRRSLGAATSREIVDERTSKDPSGMPKGEYIVMVYKTQFSGKTAYELVTLYLDSGKWSVSTYNLDTKGI